MVEYFISTEKFADAHTFKTNFSQKLFSNTLGSNSGIKNSTDNWKFLARGTYNNSDYRIPER
jgi:iron complex outermembrane receptor protein